MHTGLFLFVGAPATVDQKIKDALDRYQKKHGCRPNLCLVDPHLLDPRVTEITIHEITVRPYQYMPLGHIWIGIEGMPIEKKVDNPT